MVWGCLPWFSLVPYHARVGTVTLFYLPALSFLHGAWNPSTLPEYRCVNLWTQWPVPGVMNHDPPPVFVNKICFPPFLPVCLSVCSETCLSWYLVQCRNPLPQPPECWDCRLRSRCAWLSIGFSQAQAHSFTLPLICFRGLTFRKSACYGDQMVRNGKYLPFGFYFFFTVRVYSSVIGLDWVTHNVQMTTTRLAGSHL